MQRLPHVIAIVGPTSAGKSRLALGLAKEFDGEIVSADSRQVYRGLDLGTAKPAAEEQALVPHHLIDIKDPEEDYSAAEFQRDAAVAIDGILSRGKLPIIVGGTGLYVRALLENLQIPEVAPDHGLRAELEQLPAEELASRLKAADPAAAALVDLQNPRRIIRALELHRAGHSLADSTRGPRPYDALKLGLDPEPAELTDRIEQNVRVRFATGVTDEVSKLLETGIPADVLSSRVIIYGPAIGLLNGELTEEEAVEQTVRLDTQYAKRQRTWFKTDPEIRWVDGPEDAGRLVRQWQRREVTA